MAYRIVGLAALVLLLGACATEPERIRVVETVEVPAPYAVHRTAPAWLADGYRPDALPEFIEPAAEDATVALDAEGAQLLRALLRELREREKAWREWATAPDP